MDWILAFTLLASVFSIIEFFIGIFRNRNTKVLVILISASFVFCLSSIYVAHLHTKLNRIEDIYRSATTVLNSSYSSHEAFINAGLSFLESNKDLYPDSYARGLEIYTESKTSSSIYALFDAREEIKGILFGIAVLNDELEYKP